MLNKELLHDFVPLLNKILPASLLNLWGRHSSQIGLTFNDKEIQLLLLARSALSASHYTVLNYACLPLPAGTIIEKKIKTPREIIEVLTQLLTLLKCNTQEVVIALPDSQVITKQILLKADLSDFELESEIEFEAAKNIPLPMENVSLDYHVLGPSETELGQVNVLLIASLNAPIEEYTQILMDANLQASVIDIESYALQRSVQHCLTQVASTTPQDLVVLFDFEGAGLNFIALHKNNLIYHHQETLISDEFTRIVIAHYNLEPSLSSYAEWSALVPEQYLTEIFPQIQHILLSQMTHCLQLFSSSTFFDKINLVFLSGDIALIPGVKEWLSKEFLTSVLLADPLVNMSFAAGVDESALKKQTHTLMRVMGLALRGCS